MTGDGSPEREKRDIENINLYLSGDFGGPLQVAADDTLTRDQKLEILKTWRADLASKPDAGGLREAVARAIEGLERDKN